MSTETAERRMIHGWPVTDVDHANFEAYVLDETGPGGRVARLSALAGTAGGQGALFQMFWSSEYREKRVRLSANLRTKEATMGGLCLRVDARLGGGMLAFDN